VNKERIVRKKVVDMVTARNKKRNTSRDLGE